VIEGTVIQASTIPRIKHDEAMAITEVENHRLGELLADITPEQWALPTDCTRWDVRAVAVHLIASAEAQASPSEMIKLMRAGPKLMTEIDGIYPVDGINEAALRARTHLSPAELPALWRTVAAKALRARQRIPAPIRALPLLKLAPKVWKPVGYLFTTSASPATYGCTALTSAEPSTVPSRRPPTTTVASWPTSSPNGRPPTPTRST
jgi:hypothetical protein